MTDLAWRMAMFLIGCMGARFGLAFLARALPAAYLPYMAVPAFALAFGFALIYVKGWRKTGPETRGDVIWWNALRPVHAGLWFVFALMALARDRRAWLVLLADAVLGLVAFLAHHFMHLM